MLAIDHVIIVVADLDDAARRYDDDLGLSSVPGGRHGGHGTGNRIVPLGATYLELMAVVDADEAAASALGSWVAQRLDEAGAGPAALCLRTDDAGAVAAATGRPALAMGRTRPDGVRLEWRLVALDAAISDGLPFFIQWHVDEADHPGRAIAVHRSGANGIEWVDVGADPVRLAAWLGPHELPIRVVDGPSGPRRVAVGVAGGSPIVIG